MPLNTNTSPEAQRARSARSSFALVVRREGPDSEGAAAARARWRNAQWEAAVAGVVEAAPPFADLDAETRERVRALLQPIVRGGSDQAVGA